MPTLEQVRSLAYVIVPDAPVPIVDAIRSSPADLVILGNLSPSRLTPGLVNPRDAQDPLNDKLVIGYMDVGESTALVTRHYLGIQSAAALPSWFGAANPGWLGTDAVDHLYTVQYWTPTWLDVIKAQIDDQIAAGFDGMFLDVLSADLQWAAGNAMGNPVRSDATALLAELVGSIRTYVDSLALERPFYLVGNNPITVAPSHPQVLSDLDAVFNESLYWTHNPNDGTSRVPTGGEGFVTGTLAALYAGQVVFGNDYPPLADPQALFDTFKTYARLGWVPTVNQPFQTGDVLVQGPHMFLTNQAMPAAAGAPAAMNFLAAGNHASAVLTGGGSTDYFLGSMGSVTMNGQAGDDVFHPHADGAYRLGGLALNVSGQVAAGISPVIDILVNGHVVLAGVAVSALRTAGQSQTVTVPLDPAVPVGSVEIRHTNDEYITATEDRNVYVNELSLNGTVLPLSLGTYFRDYGLPDIAGQTDMVWGGRMVFSGPEVAGAGAFRQAGSALVDGGEGMDQVFYEGRAADYAITAAGPAQWSISSANGSIAPDTLRGVERLVFDGSRLALDMDGHAGTAAMFLGAVFGSSMVRDAGYVGIGLRLLDAGTSPAALMQLALNSALGGTPSNEAVVNLLYFNLFGVPPSPEDLRHFTGILDRGEMTQAGLGLLAADSSINRLNVDLTGLAATGLAYF